MNKLLFYKIVDLVKGHPTYQFTSRLPQVDVRIQVAVVLEGLGSITLPFNALGVGSKFCCKCKKKKKLLLGKFQLIIKI